MKHRDNNKPDNYQKRRMEKEKSIALKKSRRNKRLRESPPCW